MDLFIKTPRQVSERMERERRVQDDRRDAPQGVPAVGAPPPGRGAVPVAAGGRAGDGACGRQDVTAAAGRAQGFQAAAPQGAGRAGYEAYSVAQEAYREELAFDKRRTRRRKRLALLRVVGLIIGIPLLLAVVFVGSYVCTCILNGATPEEVAELLGEMAGHVTSFFAQLG